MERAVSALWRDRDDVTEDEDKKKKTTNKTASDARCQRHKPLPVLAIILQYGDIIHVGHEPEIKIFGKKK